jgi:folate-binding protein YgfZ
VRARLERFRLRVDCELEGPLEGLDCVAFRGPDSSATDVETDGEVLRAPASWPGVEGFDVFAPAVTFPERVVEAPAEAYEAVRIEAGWPSMSGEITARTLPGETGLTDVAVSFTKGCYVGQELVERIDARGGHVPRQLRGVVVEDDVVPPVGAEVIIDGRVVARLTSVAESLDLRAPVALALVARKVEPPVRGLVRWDERAVPARVESLPLV